MSEELTFSLIEAHQYFAKLTNHQIWDLLENPERSTLDNEDLLLAAYASIYHWKQVGTAVHIQRGYWMLSRVYIALGKSEDALNWAIKCQEISVKKTEDMEDFDLAFAQEGLARAYALAKKRDLAKNHLSQAILLGEQIEDPEDRQIFQDDLNGGDWYQLGLLHRRTWDWFSRIGMPE